MGYNPSHNPTADTPLTWVTDRLAPGIAAVFNFLRLPVPRFIAHAGPGPLKGEQPALFPVETVNWYDAVTFCNKLSVLDGKTPVYSVEGVASWKILSHDRIPSANNENWNNAIANESANGYRLPTEMEWIWAALGAERGGADVRTIGYTKLFAGAGGGGLLGNYVWYGTNSIRRTHQTGMKSANELGLKDMSGNVAEWCQDNYDAATRIVKGANFDSDFTGVKPAARSGKAPQIREEYNGLRIVCPKN
jgi:formylglycine-generating enzyme required for sulfatase activity